MEIDKKAMRELLEASTALQEYRCIPSYTCMSSDLRLVF